MGILCFTNCRKSTPESPRPQSSRFNIFSSSSRPSSPSRKKTSFLSRNRNSSRKRFVFGGSGKARGSQNFPLPSAAELETVFKKFDTNGDGKISLSELRELMRLLGHDPGEEELSLMMTEADCDGDGFVDLSEFVALNTKGVDSAATLNDLRSAFQMFDADGNGSISAQELHNVLGRLGENCSMADCHSMISGVDSDGDGQVSFDEFLAMMINPNAC